MCGFLLSQLGLAHAQKLEKLNMKGIEFMLKTLEARDPRAKTFDPKKVVDSSFLEELENSGFIETVWTK